MFTRRAYGLLLLATGLLFAALPLGQHNVMLLALTFLTWFGVEAGFFALRVEQVASRLRLVRTLDGRSAGRSAVWAGRPILVGLELRCSSSWRLPYVLLTDRLPSIAGFSLLEREGGESPFAEESTPAIEMIRAEGECSQKSSLRTEYWCLCLKPGRLRFEGVRISISDLQGLFRHTFFLRDPVEVTVLPPLRESVSRSATIKNYNLLPWHGVHRFRRPGSGSELLDLREYIPGDPPKTIAWKVSARRGKLMTKEYESEVPVRCTLFVDISDSMRVGPPGNTPLVDSIGIAAGVARQLIAHHDPVGLCLFDANGAQMLAPELGNRHLLRIHASLAQAASLPMQPSACSAWQLISPTYKLCAEIYPELLSPRINRPSSWYRRWRGFSLPWYLYLLFMVPSLLMFLPGIKTPTWLRWDKIFYLLGFLGLLIVIIRLLFRIFFPDVVSRKSRQRRGQLSAVLAARYGLGPGGSTLLEGDDVEFSRWAQKLLIEHQAPFSRPLYGSEGNYLFASPEKVGVLKRYMLRAITHCRDNELFVLMVDLLELPDQWSEFLKVVKVALARHHQVIVLCPWPAGLPIPTNEDLSDLGLAETDPLGRRFEDLVFAMRQLDVLRYRGSYLELRGQLGRLKVPFQLVGASDSVHAILRRIEYLRTATKSRI